jgi:hypothetical protein
MVTIKIKVIGDRGSFTIRTKKGYYKKGDFTNESGTIKKIVYLKSKKRQTGFGGFNLPKFKMPRF